MYCTKCSHQNSVEAKFCISCGSDVLTSLSSLQIINGKRFNNNWRRIAATLIDSMIIVIVAGILGSFMPNIILFQVFLYFFAVLYSAILLSSYRQATVGKMALGIMVTDIDGKKITFIRALVRELSKFISFLTFLIGFLMITWNEKKQGLHDIIAGTVVIKKELSPVEESPVSISSVDTPKIEVLTAETKTRDKAIDEGFEKLKRIRSYKDKINEIGIRGQLEELCNIADNIMVSVEKNPEEVKVIRKFLTYYLDAVIHILEKYTEIISLDALSKEAKDLEAKVKNVLETVKIGFQKQLSKLFEDDVLDLEAEIKLLESTIKMD